MLKKEQILKTISHLFGNYKKIRGNVSLLVSGEAISIASSLILAYILANYLSPSILGQYKYVQSIAGLALTFCLSNLGRALLTTVSKHPSFPIAPIFSTYLIWSIPMSIILLCISGYYYFATDILFGTSYLLMAALLPFMGAFDLQYSYLFGIQAYRQVTGTKNFRTILTTIVLGTAAFLSDSALLIITAYFFSYFFSAFIAYLFTLHRHKQELGAIERYKNEIESTIRYGKHLSLISVLSGITRHLDKVIVFHTIATTVPDFLNLPMRILGSLALPLSAKKDLQYLKKILPVRIVALIAVNGIIIVTYNLLAPFIFSIFFPQYMSALSFSKVYALFMLFSPFLLIDSALTAHEKKEAQYVASVVPSLVRIVLFFILIPTMGIYGAIFTILLSKFATHSLNVYYLFKKQKHTT
jgi:O-antigen/teichoic acid export membrane protein